MPNIGDIEDLIKSFKDSGPTEKLQFRSGTKKWGGDEEWNGSLVYTTQGYSHATKRSDSGAVIEMSYLIGLVAMININNPPYTGKMMGYEVSIHASMNNTNLGCELLLVGSAPNSTEISKTISSSVSHTEGVDIGMMDKIPTINKSSSYTWEDGSTRTYPTVSVEKKIGTDNIAAVTFHFKLNDSSASAAIDSIELPVQAVFRVNGLSPNFHALINNKQNLLVDNVKLEANNIIKSSSINATIRISELHKDGQYISHPINVAVNPINSTPKPDEYWNALIKEPIPSDTDLLKYKKEAEPSFADIGHFLLYDIHYPDGGGNNKLLSDAGNKQQMQLRSLNGTYTLTMQYNGNLVIRDHSKNGAVIWSSNTKANGLSYLELQDNGNICVRTVEKIVRNVNNKSSSNKSSSKFSSCLCLQEDGKLGLYDQDNNELWNSFDDVTNQTVYINTTGLTQEISDISVTVSFSESATGVAQDNRIYIAYSRKINDKFQLFISWSDNITDWHEVQVGGDYSHGAAVTWFKEWLYVVYKAIDYDEKARNIITVRTKDTKEWTCRTYIDGNSTSRTPGVGVHKDYMYMVYHTTNYDYWNIMKTCDGQQWTHVYVIGYSRTTYAPTFASFDSKLYMAFFDPNNRAEIYISYTDDEGSNWKDTKIRDSCTCGTGSFAGSIGFTTFNNLMYIVYPDETDKGRMRISYTDKVDRWAPARQLNTWGRRAAITSFKGQLIVIYSSYDGSRDYSGLNIMSYGLWQ